MVLKASLKFADFIQEPPTMSYRGQHSTMVSKLASGPSCPGFYSQHSRNILRGKFLSMLLRLINGAAERKVDSGLKMSIEPI